jgi:hypothetical protein
MSLRDKLLSIAQPPVPAMPVGSARTIGDFWTSFVAPLLPKKEIMEQWFELLNAYTKSTDPVFAIRAFSDRQGGQDEALRRGFYNTTNAGFSFFYTDNFFAAYFEKMAMDGFVPSLAEFATMLKNRTFPARFGQCCETERLRAAYDIQGRNGKNPGFGGAGYKIAHIVDSGMNFQIGNEILGMAEICARYFPRGQYNDWTECNQEYWVRHLDNLDDQPEAKEILIAHFLRFACPLNYFLTPKPTTNTRNIHGNQVRVRFVQCDVAPDIAEYTPLQKYAILQFNKLYGPAYKNYFNLLKYTNGWPTESEEQLANIEINIEYGPWEIDNPGERPVPPPPRHAGKQSRYNICWDNEKIENAQNIPMNKIGLRAMQFLTEAASQTKRGTFQLDNVTFGEIAQCRTVTGWQLLEDENRFQQRSEETRNTRYHDETIQWNNQTYHATNQWVGEERDRIIEIIQNVTRGRMTIHPA